ncbi:hypothetical protein J5N97_024752 [Dioscorea zingiberensis]|uniref:Uncharacterized protein n=1 Tax=Dioscorea zingiberensis TaxID=325984 RepID=A0A9D5C7J3_9LILI|nr:hypothetical protein J5N97_024752 [Dioscorea zingiberensis]
MKTQLLCCLLLVQIFWCSANESAWENGNHQMKQPQGQQIQGFKAAVEVSQNDEKIGVESSGHEDEMDVKKVKRCHV